MAEPQPFKAYLNANLVNQLAEKIKSAYADFPTDAFVTQASAGLDELELKARTAHIAAALHDHLPAEYAKATDILLVTLGPENDTEKGVFEEWYFLMPVAYFVEVYGLEEFEVSMRAMYEITKRHTSEFAVRPFLIRYPKRTLQQLHEWVTDENAHIRRWVSEGTRPRLPWGRQLPIFIENPRPVLTLLEYLKNDPSLYVRRSVANNLNDISKDHPDLVIETLTRWHKGATEGTLWLIRHALRTLVKQGHPDALRLLGYGEAQVALDSFEITPSVLQFGNKLTLSCTLRSTSLQTQELMIDYLIHFIKANGKTRAKVFKWSKKTLNAGKSLMLQKRHTIKPITTRRYYNGCHRVQLQINGKIMGDVLFELENV